jgi:hypothetical protein
LNYQALISFLFFSAVDTVRFHTILYSWRKESSCSKPDTFSFSVWEDWLRYNNPRRREYM